MAAGQKLPAQRHGSALRLPVDRLTQDEEVSGESSGEMNPLALHRTPARALDVNRSAARIVHTARQVEHGTDVAAIARARPAGAKVATLADIADGAGRGPVAFLRGGQH